MTQTSDNGKFQIIRELASVERDRGSKRLLLALYEASSGGVRYLALSEQEAQNEEWVSRKRGITVRRGELKSIISALQSADFDALPDTSNLSNDEYAQTLDWG